MSQFELRLHNVRGLRTVRWAPPDLALLVGPNGSGKTTLLLALRFLRLALERTPQEAVSLVFGGAASLKNAYALVGELVSFELSLGGPSLRWRLDLVLQGSFAPVLSESLWQGEEQVCSRHGSGPWKLRGREIAGDERSVLRLATDAFLHDPDVDAMVAFVHGLRVFFEPDLWALRERGSDSRQDSRLASRGENAFAVLRAWSQTRESRPRFQFVLDGLKAAFPGRCDDLDFDAPGVGHTVSLRLYQHGVEQGIPAMAVANGILAMLVLLCGIASLERGGVVALDEPENALHPFAQRELLSRARQWSKAQDGTILLATHSPVLLDAMNGEPERVFVLPKASDEDVPLAVTSLREREWLAYFHLGSLYAEGELGSNDDEGLPGGQEPPRSQQVVSGK